MLIPIHNIAHALRVPGRILRKSSGLGTVLRFSEVKNQPNAQPSTQNTDSVPDRREPDDFEYRNRWFYNQDPIIVTQSLLECLANHLSSFFIFEHSREGVNIRDVLRARKGIEGKDWDFVRYEEDQICPLDPYEEIWVKKGNTIAWCPLPELFAECRWELLEEMADRVEKNEGSRISYASIQILCSMTRVLP